VLLKNGLTKTYKLSMEAVRVMQKNLNFEMHEFWKIFAKKKKLLLPYTK
jgi:hypothetical protein